MNKPRPEMDRIIAALIGNWLKEKRLHKGYTHQDVVDRIDELKDIITEPWLKQIESGEINIPAKCLYKLSSLYSIELDEFLAFTNAIQKAIQESNSSPIA